VVPNGDEKELVVGGEVYGGNRGGVQLEAVEVMGNLGKTCWFVEMGRSEFERVGAPVESTRVGAEEDGFESNVDFDCRDLLGEIDWLMMRKSVGG
jgi:hypothetical protein